MSTRRLIEEWLPIAALSEECSRERRSMTALPPVYYLHVWWARRPLVASRAAIMASLLPADADRNRFVHALGIHGDPVKTKQRLDEAKRTGEKLGTNPYGYARAFNYSLSQEELNWFFSGAQHCNDCHEFSVLDPTSGGGSIPFESLRLHLNTFANDINPVAVLIQKATYDLSQFGVHVYKEFKRIGKRFIEKAEPLYNGIFPREAPGTQVLGYLFARTIRCPYCGGLIPLSPCWSLASNGTGVRLVPHTEQTPSDRVCSFEIVHSVSEQSEGTVHGGSATCPFPDCGRVIDGDQIKALAQNGDMDEQLYTVVFKKRTQITKKNGKQEEKWLRGYRAPRPEDDVFEAVRARLEEKLPYWEAMDMVPTESVPDGLKTTEPLHYGIQTWRDFFSPRQLYCHCTSVEVFRELLQEESAKPGFGELQKAAFAYLALALDKLCDYNSRMTLWIPKREVMAHTFGRHDFSFKWSYAEMAPLIVGLGYDWAIEQIAKCLSELTGLLDPSINVKALKQQTKNSPRFDLAALAAPAQQHNSVTLTCKSADCLDHIADHSIDAIVMDPPYYDNVMYAELSDFFYVWLKRTAGYLYPELFTLFLTDKENEAVANKAKFKGQAKPQVLAHRDYQERMAAIFAECRRVLKQDGILTLMFTHKATGAWDALTKGLLEAGFTISASWPVNTEAENSLHIKDKAAAKSTILLVCRPREDNEDNPDREILFWEDIEPMVRQHVLDKLRLFQQAGISGIDLYLSCFGPALEFFSRHWPVRRGSPKSAPVTSKKRRKTVAEEPADPYAVTPEDVLQTARSAVKDWILQYILQTRRQSSLDGLLEWFVLAWHSFRAPQFPYDEALNLARVVGLDMDSDIIGVIAGKKQSDVVLWDSGIRAAKAALGPADGSRSMLDALHHAAHTAQTQSLQAALEQLRQHGLDKNPAFLDGLRAVLEVLPPSRSCTGIEPARAVQASASDFEALENLRRLALAEQVTKPRQLSLLDVTDA